MKPSAHATSEKRRQNLSMTGRCRCDRWRNRSLAGHSTGAPAGPTTSCWRGASGIACANDANVNAKASAINLVMLLSLPVTKRNEQIMASELVDLIQIKQGGL